MAKPTHRDGSPKRPKPFFVQLCALFPQIPKEDLPNRHRSVLLALANFARPDGAGAFPSLGLIGAIAGLGRTLLCETLAELKAARWIRTPKRPPTPTGRYTSSAYVLALGGGPIVLSPSRAKRPGRYTFGPDAPDPTTH